MCVCVYSRPIGYILVVDCMDGYGIVARLNSFVCAHGCANTPLITHTHTHTRTHTCSVNHDGGHRRRRQW